jgi:4-hydroxythreonine-4-phosphate dehydrogenase
LPSEAGGEASVRFVLAAIEAVRAGRIDAIVTGPISKDAVRQAGYPWPGHTELLAEKFEAPDVAMMFAGGPFRVILVTIHVALAEAIREITVDAILRVMRLGSTALWRQFGIAVPRLGVCGLNPHAGEAGRFGFEEREIIEPAIEQARAEGLCAFGPLPPDTAFYQAMKGKFDLMVAMYHDQGLIPLKTVAFEDSVNITLGLPVVRTSVDHGTAYDIAGRGLASPRSMKAAIRIAVEMVERGRRFAL